MVIEVENLTKSYDGVQALKGVSFTVEKGEVFAYLGPNGAGKTTTINILCGLLPRDGGTARICGLDIADDPVAVKQRIGVVPENSNLYPELTCRGNLEYLGELYGLPRNTRRRRAEQLLDEFNLKEKSEALFRTLSRGMKRRLTVAAALIHEPEVVFLDEPTVGLDVPSARALRERIRSIHESGATVFLTTHNLAEAELLSDRVAFLAKGQIVAQGKPDEIRNRIERARRLDAVFSKPIDSKKLVERCPSLRLLSQDGATVRLEIEDTHEAIRELLVFAEEEKARLVDVSARTPTLEEAFVEIVEKSQQP